MLNKILQLFTIYNQIVFSEINSDFTHKIAEKERKNYDSQQTFDKKVYI